MTFRQWIAMRGIPINVYTPSTQLLLEEAFNAGSRSGYHSGIQRASRLRKKRVQKAARAMDKANGA